jgi:tRNA-splicing ligase RtcB (3'-phosphate/5'-hydroxy nucleic acid ligase)
MSRSYEMLIDCDSTGQWFGGHSPIKMWTKGVPVEEEAQKQLINVAKMPFIHKHIAVMPDVHWGMGATVGSVIATKRAIIPAAVGVDIGCGMMAVKTSLKAKDLPDNLHAIRTAIEKAVPHGRSNNGRQGDVGAWGNTPLVVREAWSINLHDEYVKLIEKYPILKTANYIQHLGTLGTGNHFIEVCIDNEADVHNVWIMLHSGSRGIGNKVGSHFIELAKKDMEKWFIHLPDDNLAYFPQGSEYFDDYWKAVSWCQKFAKINRELMMEAVLYAMGMSLDLPSFHRTDTIINCHHNYVAIENHFGENCFVTRKGAVRARQGDMGIIPGSMGACSYIVKGKGNPDSFHSCSHGAGRKMSRNEARKRFTLEDHAEAVKGVECRVDEEVIDETPGAYKDIDLVMKAQEDLVEVVTELKQVICVKG